MKPFHLLLFVTQLYIPATRSGSLKIEGSIDLGQNWDFEPLTQDLDLYRTYNQQPTTMNIEPITATNKKRHKKRKIKGRNLTTISRLKNTEKEKPTVAWLDESLPPRVTYITGSTTERSTVSKRKRKHHRSKLAANQSLAVTDAMPIKYVAYTEQTKSTTKPSKVLLDVMRDLGINISKYDLPVLPLDANTVSEAPKVTELIVYNRPDADTADLYDRPHFVKDDEKIQAFTIFVFRQSLGIFDKLKSGVDSSRIKNKVDFIARNFRDKFADFVNETQNQKILTSLGRQKVVLNTIDTSNRILRRLLNYFTMDMKKKGSLKEMRIMAEDWKDEVDKEEQQEYVYACQSMNICRMKNTFSSFMAEMVTIVLGTDDTKLTQAVNAFTEVAKNTNFGVDKDKAMKIKDSMKSIENMSPMLMRAGMWMFRNMLTSKNNPIGMVLQNGKALNNTLGIMSLVDKLDEKIPGTPENQKTWNGMKSNLEQWAKGGKVNVMDVVKTLMTHVMTKVPGFGDILGKIMMMQYSSGIANLPKLPSLPIG